MKFSYLLISLYILFLISNSKCKEEDVEFRVQNIELPQVSCIPNLGTYIFYLKGNFNISPLVTNIIELNLENPTNSKSICYPLEKTSVSSAQLQCIINTCDYPINSENILLPIEPPNTLGYKFPNWKELIGANPGTSNKIPEDNIKCLPKEINSYTLSSIKSQGCSNKKNIILVNGKWNDETQLVPNEKNFVIKLINNNIANCHYNNKNDIQCELNSYGEVKFIEQYFKCGVNVFKFEKSDYSINVEQCNSSSSSFIFLNKIIIFIILLFL